MLMRYAYRFMREFKFDVVIENAGGHWVFN